MNLIHDVHFVFACLWSKANLFNQASDIIHRIIAGSIEFMYIQRGAGIKWNAAVTIITGFTIFGARFTVDGLCQNSGTGSFTHSSWATK